MVPFYASIEKYIYKNIVYARIGTKSPKLVPKVTKNEEEKIFKKIFI